jgi:S1-C subfamily serine protease
MVPVSKTVSKNVFIMMQVVEPKGPASQAGFLGTRRSLGGVVAGDVILSMGSKRIQSAADVDACLDNYSIGDTVSVRLRRATNGVRSPLAGHLSPAV